MSGTSLIIPHWNRPAMLEESLICLMKRTPTENNEIVVVDDGSEPIHLAEVKKMAHLYHRLVELPYKKRARLTSFSYMAGLKAANQAYAYVFFGADDLLYRSGWLNVLIEMLDSEWAERNKVKIVSGFNHWVQPEDYNSMKSVVPEMYKSADGKVEGYCSVWAGNWFMRKRVFRDMGQFENNLNPNTLPEQVKNNYEMIMLERFKQNGWHWGTTAETYTQTIATENSSTLNNYHYEDPEETRKLIDWHHKNGIAIGVNWKDE